MFPAIGLVVLLVMVFGGFAITGGALGPVMHAIPHEMLIIGGAAAGALIIGNSGAELKAMGGGLAKVFKGPKYKKQDYLDVIFLVSKLMKMLRMEGPIALEPHVEDPKSSAVFATTFFSWRELAMSSLSLFSHAWLSIGSSMLWLMSEE